jgi:hypothetical protein
VFRVFGRAQALTIEGKAAHTNKGVTDNKRMLTHADVC